MCTQNNLKAASTFRKINGFCDLEDSKKLNVLTKFIGFKLNFTSSRFRTKVFYCNHIEFFFILLLC